MKTPGKIFAVNAHLGACISCYLYCFHGALVVIKFAKLSSQMKNSKQKSPLEPRKTNKQTSPTQKRKETFLCRKEKKKPLWKLRRLFKQSAWAVCTLICSCTYQDIYWLVLPQVVLLPLTTLFLFNATERENMLQCNAFPWKSWSWGGLQFHKAGKIITWHGTSCLQIFIS